MKTLITCIVLLGATLFTLHAQEKTTSIEVEVTNVTSDSGSVIFGLYTEDIFMKAAPLKSVDGKIQDGKVSVTFDDVAPGSYSILCYHDTNDNKQMDFEPNGMPMESYGSSNNVMNTMGPPTWEETKFTVGAETTKLEIRF